MNYAQDMVELPGCIFTHNLSVMTNVNSSLTLALSSGQSILCISKSLKNNEEQEIRINKNKTNASM